MIKFTLLLRAQRIKKWMDNLSSEDESIINFLNKLKEQIVDQNYLKINNLTALAHNIQLLFSYSREAFIVMKHQKQTIERELNHLKLRIHENELDYLLQEIDENYQDELQSVNEKMRQAMLKKHEIRTRKDHSGKRRKRFEKKSISEGEISDTASKIQQKRKKSKQIFAATLFVQNYLKDKIQAQQTKTRQLPKNSILNYYLDWKQKNNERVDFSNHGLIQMALTNEIKKQFPFSTQNSRSFKGIKFIDELESELRTDVKLRLQLRQNQVAQDFEDQDSPPLPDFPDDYMVNQMESA